MPQNCWVDGRPHWRGIQLDEVAFPIMLAWHCIIKGFFGGFDPWPMVKAGAAYVAQKRCRVHLRSDGKRTQASPFKSCDINRSIGLHSRHCEQSVAPGKSETLPGHCGLLGRTNVERWTYTTCGSLLKDNPEYFLGISSTNKKTKSGEIQDPG